MLEKLDQNIIMTKTSQNNKHQLSIHHSNLFRPKPLGVCTFDINGNKEYLAVIKEYRDDESDQQNESINIIEIHRVVKTNTPKLLQSIIEYEKITGVAWAYNCHLITVTRQQTINLYDTRKGVKVFTTLTDYGPILCMKFSMLENLLITGTEYGYVAAYTIDKTSKKLQVVPQSKLVKVSGGIESIDYTIRTKETAAQSQKVPKTDRPAIINAGKRKRSESSSSGDSSDDDDKKQDESFLSKFDLTIFGAVQQDIVAWDFHKKTIIETIRLDDDKNFTVNTICALRRGKVVVGDSKGTVSIIDENTFTCKQTLDVLQSGVLSIAKTCDEKTLIISGKDPSIVILKRDLSNIDNYVFFEKIELHKQSVTCITCASKGTFFTGSQDGMLARFSLKGGGKERLKLYKEVILHNYSNHIKFSDEQMMIQSAKSLIVWKLPEVKKFPSKSMKSLVDNIPQEEDLTQLKPLKLLLLKTRGYIQASAFSKRWICYSTKRGVHIFDRSADRLISYGTDKKLLNCSHLQLCFEDRYLLAGEYDRVYLISLDETSVINTSNDTERAIKKFPIIAEKNLHSSIRQICFIKWSNTIVICCVTPKYHVYMFSYHDNPADIFVNNKRLTSKTIEISFITYNASTKTDHNLYLYSNDDKIIKLDPSDYEDNVKSTIEFSNLSRIEDLPVDINILGMFILTKNTCILYDSNCMYKVDLQTNKVIKKNSDYNFIIKMDNSGFDNSDEVALVELTPEHYIDSVPPLEEKFKKKFGT